jgi:hypothetical protein
MLSPCLLIINHILSLLYDNPDARGLYGISFPYYETLAAIYSKDITTREGAEGIGEAVSNMDKEIALGDSLNEVEEDHMSMDTPQQSLDSRNSMDSTSSSSKRRKKAKDNSKGNEPSLSSDPFLDMVGGLHGDLNKVSQHFRKMAEAWEREAKVQAEATQNDPMQMLQEKSIAELTRLGFTGNELLKAATVFMKIPNQMTMLFALPENLRREFIQNMLAGKLLFPHFIAD